MCGSVTDTLSVHYLPTAHLLIIIIPCPQTNQIILALGDLDSSNSTLKQLMGFFQSGARDCAKTAKDIDDLFTNWLNYVSELHQVSVQQETTVEAQRLANESQLAAKKAQLDLTEEARKGAADAVETLKGNLATAQEAYKKASDEYPSGMPYRSTRKYMATW